MKILVIPDVHGTSEWKKAYTLIDQVDKCIFLGDYVDNWEEQYKGQVSIDNFKEIVKFKQDYPDKVDLLPGNHDISYFLFTGQANSGVSGHQYHFSHLFSEMFKEAFPYMQLASKYDDWVFSHAGFSKTWFTYVKKGHSNIELPEDAVEAANMLFKNQMITDFNFSPYCWDGTGNSVFSGPLWIRPEALLKDALYDKQVVGHTEYAIVKPAGFKNKNVKLLLTDNREHDNIFIFDTEKPGKFITYDSFCKLLKTVHQKVNDGKSQHKTKEEIIETLHTDLKLSKKESEKWFNYYST